MDEDGARQAGAWGPARACELSRISLLKPLSDNQLETLFPKLEHRQVHARAILNYRADVGERACLVWSGGFEIMAHIPAAAPVSRRRESGRAGFGKIIDDWNSLA
jgi:hypothetical protein